MNEQDWEKRLVRVEAICSRLTIFVADLAEAVLSPPHAKPTKDPEDFRAKLDAIRRETRRDMRARKAAKK